MIVPVFLPHLGCHERCIYCDQGAITDIHDQDIRSRIERVLARIDGTYEIGLYGGNIFGIKPRDLRRFFEYFRDYDTKISGFRISTKPIPPDDETIRILKEYGVTVIELGMPVFNNDILAQLNRKHTVEDFFRTFQMLKHERFHVALQSMVGLPGESVHDIRETAAQVIRLRPHYIRIYPLVVLEGTPLHSMYEKGLFRPIPFEDAVERAAYIYLNALQNGIKTVKMGLTDNEIIQEKVMAGHFHPAFGYMVKSHAFYLAVRTHLDAASITGKVTVQLNRRDVPHLLGHKRTNIRKFEAQGISVSWEEKEVKEGGFIILGGLRTTKGTIFDAISVLATDSKVAPTAGSKNHTNVPDQYYTHMEEV